MHVLPGEKVVSAICLKNFEQEVETSLCSDADKPETGVFPCNKQHCTPRYC